MKIRVTVNTPDSEYEFDYTGTPDHAMQDAMRDYPDVISMVLVFSVNREKK
jgi:hypothetical protein